MSLLGLSAYNSRKKNQMYQYSFTKKKKSNVSIFVLWLSYVHILATVWDTSMPISNSAVFQHTVLDPLKQSRFDFSNPKQTFVRIQLLEIDYGRSLFSDSFVPDASKIWALSSHTTVDWKHQRCKCTMV